MTDPQLQKRKAHCDMWNCEICNLETPSNDGLDQVFYKALRGKTVTEEQAYILEWAAKRLKPAIRAWHKEKALEMGSVRYKAAVADVLGVLHLSAYLTPEGEEYRKATLNHLAPQTTVMEKEDI